MSLELGASYLLVCKSHDFSMYPILNRNRISFDIITLNCKRRPLRKEKMVHESFSSWQTVHTTSPVPIHSRISSLHGKHKLKIFHMNIICLRGIFSDQSLFEKALICFPLSSRLRFASYSSKSTAYADFTENLQLYVCFHTSLLVPPKLENCTIHVTLL